MYRYIKDTRVGQAGNTISLSKQVIPDGGIKSVADIGSVGLLQVEST